MGQSIEVPFALQEGKGASPQNSEETLTNMYAEPDFGRKQLVRRQRPGVKAFVYAGLEQVESMPPRFDVPQGIERYSTIHYFVMSGYLFAIDSAGIDDITVGKALTGFNTVAPVTIAFNDNDQVLFCDGTNLLYTTPPFNIPSGVVTVAGAATCCELGGFGIFNEPDSSRFYITGLNDFTTVDPLDFASAESYKDDIVRVFRLGNMLVLFGETSTEFWELSGGTDFPFSPITNAVITRGILGPFAVVAEDNTAFFIAEDGLAYRLEGYRPSRISTPTVERLIGAMPKETRAQCRALVYTHQGSKFVTFTWAGLLTLQYNVQTGLWNRAKTYGKNHWDLIGSAVGPTDLYLSGRMIVCELDPDQFWDDTFTDPLLIERIARSAPGDAGGKKISVHSFELDVEVGMTEPFNLLQFGGPNELVYEPRVMLRRALDGMTFGNERWKTLGRIGNFLKKVIWRSLGQGRKPTIEITVTDPCRLTIMGAMAEIEVDG